MAQLRRRGFAHDPESPVDNNPGGEFVTKEEPKVHSEVTAKSPPTPPSTSLSDINSVETFLNWWSNDAPTAFVFVVLLSAFTRFWIVPEPFGVVFDEVHFGGFVQNYLRGEYFFDIHPPLGKIVMTWLAILFGYDGTHCDYTGDHYDERCPYYILRYIAAFWGFLLPPVVYLITRQLGGSVMAGTFAACLLIFDLYNVIEARCVLTDSQLMFHIGFSFLVATLWWNRRNRVHEAGETMSLRERIAWVFAVGLTCGAAVSVKWTALATPGMIAVESFFAVWILHRSVPLPDLFGVAGVVIAEYITWWGFHFWMLPKSGPGDGYAPLEFQRTLLNSRHYDPEATWSFLPTTYRLNKDMLLGSAAINTPHTWESKYYQWIVNARGVLYWGGPSGPQPGLWRAMYLIGNPLVVWGCGILIIVFILSGFLYLRYRSVHKFSPKVSKTLSVCTFCFFMWFFGLAPYALVTRQAFAYHYMPSLMVAQILSSLWLDGALPVAIRNQVMRSLLIIVGGVFVFYAPWVYALPLTPEGHEARRWLKTWD